MHNLVTAGNVNKIQQEANARILDEAVSYTAYSYWVPASEMVYSTGKVIFTAPTASNPPFWTFYEGSAGYVGAYIRRHNEWRNGYFKAKLHWTAPSKNTDAAWRLAIDPVPLNPTAATIPSSNLVAFVTTCTSASAMMVTPMISSELNIYSKISSIHSGVVLYFGKSALPTGDTMTVDRQVYGIELIYHEKTKQAGSYDT